MQDNERVRRDWFLYKELSQYWHERTMKRLFQEYQELLDSDDTAAARFWYLLSRMKQDAQLYAVNLPSSRKGASSMICALLREGSITMEDLDGFSDTFHENLKRIMEREERQRKGVKTKRNGLY